MIRIDVACDDIKSRIEAHKPGWLADAKSRTDQLAADDSLEVVSIWSPIKEVFTKLQISKCVFCEKELEDQPIEQDVEHFRPKNNVKRWPIPSWLETDENVQLNQPASGSEDGYRLLAYNFLNYAASCKTCNSTRKSDYFPIEGTVRKSNAKNPATLKSEKALLIYPISDLDDDPEDLIEFFGLSPQAKLPSGFGRKRALVTIELFKLDDEGERSHLFKKRAQNIWTLHECFKQMQNGNATERADAMKVANHLTSHRSEHTNCMRCFARLFQADPNEAARIAGLARDYWTSGS